jgi:integrase
LKTINEAAEEWLLAIRKVRKHSTYVRYLSIYRQRIKPVIGDCGIADISQIMITQCLGLYGDNSPGPTASHVYATINILRQILTHADPSVNVEGLLSGIIKPKPCQKPIVVFTSEEQERLIRILKNHPDPYKTGILIFLMTGCRLGEICALRTEDLSTESGTMHIHATVQRIRRPENLKEERQQGDTTKTILMVTAPKTQCSDRITPVPDRLLLFLEEHPLRGEYVVNNEKLMEPRTYENKFASYQKLAQIRPKNFHTLRHTFATNCIAGGMDPKVLSEILGHSNVSITLNRYVHPSAEMKKKQLNHVFDNIYGAKR